MTIRKERKLFGREKRKKQVYVHMCGVCAVYGVCVHAWDVCV